MPAAGWHGKRRVVGNGAWAGTIGYGAMATALASGYAKASTDTDANQCVTQAETQLNATFKGNTAASIINGCGQPIDVRICLMTSTKGWNCGVGYGVGSQEKWSHSSFDATGPVFVDARISSSSRPLAHPQ
jgi:hypothetical protein